ncbi:MAG TPA: lysyl oxidase family protein [Myxococcales bacterium]|nr:lysyl oxidase family protein [Myxococcales bacterium]
MKRFLAAAIVLAGCDAPTPTSTEPTGPLVSQAQPVQDGQPDLVGVPDLIVRGDMLGGQWVVRDETFDASYCSVVEGGVNPGDHRVVRFTVGTANIGDADMFIGSPLAHYNANDGLYELSTCHNHFHFRHYALYELIGPDGHVWKAAKRGFCMLDTDPNPAWLGTPPRSGLFHNCGTLTLDGYQGVSVGWTDTYRFYLGGQYFVLDGGDGQPVVPEGDYVLRITVNPPFVARRGEACPHVDSLGFCHQLPESNYANNAAQITLHIPEHPGRSGYGPLGGSDNKNTEIDPCAD